MNLKKMAATVAKPGLIPRIMQEHNLPPIPSTDTDIKSQAEDEEPNVPPQHQRLKLNDFALVRTLGTGNIHLLYYKNIHALGVCDTKNLLFAQVHSLGFV